MAGADWDEGDEVSSADDSSRAGESADEAGLGLGSDDMYKEPEEAGLSEYDVVSLSGRTGSDREICERVILLEAVGSRRVVFRHC